MTAVLPYQPASYRANWLGRYLKVDNEVQQQLRQVLKDASKAVDAEFAKAIEKESKSGRVERTQIALAQNAIHGEIYDLFDDAEDIIYAGKQDAAVAAVNAMLYDERGLVEQLFDNEDDRVEYANSLRATARRNVEAVETRILETHIPLSEQVYRTAALANGQVDQVVNNGLALGKSARDIAKDVQPLIDPNTPGGVSYAAMRLGRSELTRSFHSQSISDALDQPWVTHMRWNLSTSHKDRPDDPCEDWDDQLFSVKPESQVPDNPHPNCMCYVTPELPDWETFRTNLIQGMFDDYLDAVLAGGEPTAAYEEVRRRKTRSDKGKKRKTYGGQPTKRVAAKKAGVKAPAKKAPVRKKRRKTRSDKGVPRGPRKAPTAAVPRKRTPAERKAIQKKQAEGPKLAGRLDLSGENKVKGVAKALGDKWGIETQSPLGGWYDLDFARVGDAKAIARGYDDFLIKFPELRKYLASLDIQYPADGGTQYATTYGGSFPGHYNPGGFGFDSKVEWNPYWTQDPWEFQRTKNFGESTGHKFKGSNVDPFYSTTIHEMGHVMDNALINAPSDLASGWVQDEYEKQLTQRTKELGWEVDTYTTRAQTKARWSSRVEEEELPWNQWLFENAPSRYSMVRGKERLMELNMVNGVAEIYPPEFIAESIADVWHNGEDAKPLSKLATRNSLRLYDRNIGADTKSFREDIMKGLGRMKFNEWD